MNNDDIENELMVIHKSLDLLVQELMRMSDHIEELQNEKRNSDKTV